MSAGLKSILLEHAGVAPALPVIRSSRFQGFDDVPIEFTGKINKVVIRLGEAGVANLRELVQQERMAEALRE